MQGEEKGKKEKKHKAATNEENGWGPEGERGAVASLTHTHKSWDTMPTHTVTDLKKKGKDPHRKHTKWMHYTLKKRQTSTWYQGRNDQPWLESISQNTYIYIRHKWKPHQQSGSSLENMKRARCPGMEIIHFNRTIGGNRKPPVHLRRCKT